MTEKGSSSDHRGGAEPARLGDPPGARHQLTPGELQTRQEAELKGLPFIEVTGSDGQHRCIELGTGSSWTVGRDGGSDLALESDRSVSRVHCELQRIGPSWAINDDGLSRNGTFVNGERVGGRRRLFDQDVIRVGLSLLVFRDPAGISEETLPAADGEGDEIAITPAQRRVLVALCRPFSNPRVVAAPASNAEIAEELSLSIDGVRSQLKALFQRLGVDGLPQSRKRSELVERAFGLGLVSHRDLE